MSTPHPVLPWMQYPHLSPAPSGDGGMPGMPPPPPHPALALSSGQGGHLPLPTAQLHMNGLGQRDSGAALNVGRRLSAPSTMCARQGLRPPSEGPRGWGHFQGSPNPVTEESWVSAWSPLLQDAVSTQGGDGFLQHPWRPVTQGLEDGAPGICPMIPVSPLLTSRSRPESQSSPAGRRPVLRRPLLATLGNHAASWTWPGARAQKRPRPHRYPNTWV